MRGAAAQTKAPRMVAASNSLNTMGQATHLSKTGRQTPPHLPGSSWLRCCCHAHSCSNKYGVHMRPSAYMP
eukprot:607362-Alexandrium_andersonii.AAC.1